MYEIVKKTPNGKTEITNLTGDLYSALVELRSEAFNCANTNKHGKYPLNVEEFNSLVEKGFNDDGTGWKAEDGTVIFIRERKS